MLCSAQQSIMGGSSELGFGGHELFKVFAVLHRMLLCDSLGRHKHLFNSDGALVTDQKVLHPNSAL